MTTGGGASTTTGSGSSTITGAGAGRPITTPTETCACAIDPELTSSAQPNALMRLIRIDNPPPQIAARCLPAQNRSLVFRTATHPADGVGETFTVLTSVRSPHRKSVRRPTNHLQVLTENRLLADRFL